MKISRLLGFHKIGVSSENSNGKIIDEGTYWEWSIRLKIPFSSKQKTTNEVNNE